MELFKPTITSNVGGTPFCEHNMPCSVCLNNPAVFHLSVNDNLAGIFSPCWECQENGYELVKRTKTDIILSLIQMAATIVSASFILFIVVKFTL